MGITAILTKGILTAIVGSIVQLQGSLSSPTEQTKTSPQAPRSTHIAQNVYAGTKLVCNTGFKPGKTPVSLKVGGKVACVNTKSATSGKKLMTALGNTCFACHSASAIIAPVTQTNANLRTQGFTLKPASITEAFNLHAAEMNGATITAAQAKSLSAYLQTIK